MNVTKQNVFKAPPLPSPAFSNIHRELAVLNTTTYKSGQAKQGDVPLSILKFLIPHSNIYDIRYET